MAKLRTPVEKLPLTVRKNLRDQWESQKAGYETSMKEVLGETWTIDLNPFLIYAYADETYSSRLGDVIVWYIEPFISNLEMFAESFGADGVQELNSACSKHQLRFGPQEMTDFNYGGLTISDGILHLVFAEGCLAVNVNEVSKDFARALKEAPASASSGSAFNLNARNAVRKDYDPHVEEVRSSIASMAGVAGIKLDPNFEANATELSKKSDSDWDTRIGWITLDYFRSLEEVLKQNKFKDDDLLQEAFQEGVEKNTVCLRILSKWEEGEHRYNEIKLDDGILFIQTTTEFWGSNVDDAALLLTDIL